jgi:hypothetical protein
MSFPWSEKEVGIGAIACIHNAYEWYCSYIQKKISLIYCGGNAMYI